MSDGVLPPLLVLPVEGEQVCDPRVQLVQGEHLAGGLLQSHGDQRDVGVRGFSVSVAPPVRLGLPNLTVHRAAVRQPVHFAVLTSILQREENKSSILRTRKTLKRCSVVSLGLAFNSISCHNTFNYVSNICIQKKYTSVSSSTDFFGVEITLLFFNIEDKQNSQQEIIPYIELMTYSHNTLN